MKKLLIGLSVLAVLFAACDRENVDSINTEIEEPTAKELEDLQLLGNVIDINEGGVLGAEIVLMQDGEIVETITSGRDGKYELTATLKPDQPIYVRATKEGFVTATDVVEIQATATELTTMLMPNEMLDRGQSSMTEREFIILTGKVVDPNGALDSRKYVLLEDATGRISYATPNLAGDFRIVALPEVELELAVINSTCQQEEYRAAIGSFTEGQDLGEITITSSANESINVSGQLIDCTGNPIANGLVVANSGLGVQRTISDASGNFSLEITSCATTGRISLFGYDEGFQNVSEAITVSIQRGSIALDPIVVCTGGTSNIELTVNGTTYNSTVAHDFLLNTRGGAGSLTYVYPLNSETGLTLNFAGQSTGTFTAVTFFYADESLVLSGGSRTRGESEVTVTVTTYETDLFEGTFSGEALNADTQLLEAVSGTFSIRK